MQLEAKQQTIAGQYQSENPTSESLYHEQAKYVPSGVSHSSRSFSPFPLFIEACLGARKWDVDGHEYVDYWLGHGSNLLGHAHPVVVAAVREQLEKGFHAGGETRLAVTWAELVCQLVPSADLVRFTTSGGEATQLALRTARAATGKDKVVKFQHHYHGWHDAVGTGISLPWDAPYAPGVPASVLRDTIVIPCNDLDVLRNVLESEQGVAGVILEPGGGYSDMAPVDPSFLAGLRELTADLGVVLIFDEVVTGFRYAVGGVQEYLGITPDLTTLGKVVGGGLPAGALAGRSELMMLLGETGDADWDRRHRIAQHGTWNANPVAAAAGVATLGIVASGEPIRIANLRADQLRAGLDQLFRDVSLPAGTYGRSSIWKTYLGDRPKCLDGDFSCYLEESERLSRGWGGAGDPLRKAMLLNGVDLMRSQGFTSAVHEERDIEITIEAFRRSIERLREEGILQV